MIRDCEIGRNFKSPSEKLLNLYECTIGDNVTIGAFVEIGPGVTIGKGCKIQTGAFIPSGVSLGDGVFIGPNATFANVRNPRAHIDQKDNFKQTVVGQGATIGANATIMCGINIGRYAMVGAGAVVVKDVPEYAIVVSPRADVIGFCEEDGV
jgi:UDP-2-acetamido-3-amino-2,3-dideoxy-glucuronate N-acetyltransferase